MFKTICYKSEANASLNLLEFEALFNQTQLKNNSHNITGVLVKRDNVFFQILEGNPIIIDTVYEEIKKDHRHSNILELLNKSITQLNFKSFDIGYAVIKDTDALYGLQKFVTGLQQNNIENSPLFLQIIEELLTEH